VRQRKVWDAATLYSRHKEGQVVSPDFQRGSVWNRTKKSEAIYSLLTIGLPEITLLEAEDGTYRILDGLQRVSSIIQFLDNEYAIKLDPTLTHLDGQLAEELEGKRFRDLPEHLQNRIRNAELGVVVYSGVSDFDVAREIFTRLNYKPTPLNEAELLYALTFSGEKSKLLAEVGREVSKRRMLGFALLSRGLAALSVARDWTEGDLNPEEEFKFSKFYDWLFKRTKKFLSEWDEETLARRAADLKVLHQSLKTEVGIDAVKSSYWWDFLGYALYEAEKKAVPAEEYGVELLPQRVKELSSLPAWRENVSQRNRQKPKVLAERFRILTDFFKRFLVPAERGS